MINPYLGRLVSLFGVKLDNKVSPLRIQKRTPNEVPLSLTNPDLWKDIIEQYSGGSNAALKVSAFYACVDRKSSDIASLPLRPLRKTTSGFTIDKEHDQYFISKEPSKNWTTQTWLKTLNTHIELRGECFSPITRKNGRPVSYGIWNPDHVKHEIDESGYITWVNTKTKQAVSDDDMIHVMWFSLDGIRGVSVLTYMRETIEMALNGKKMSANLYKNYLGAPGYLSITGDLDEEQAGMIAKYWKTNVMGESNQDSVGVLDNSSKWVPFGMTMKDGEYLGSMEFTVKEIARFMGVPGSKIGVRDANVSYNSLEQENIAYVQDTILPRVIAWEQELNRKSITDKDMENVVFKFELKSRLRGDTQQRFSAYGIGLQNGVYSINDVLRLEDQDTIGLEGDERYVNAALVKLSDIFNGNTNATKENTDTQKLFNEFIKSLNTNGNGKGHKVIQHEES